MFKSIVFLSVLFAVNCLAVQPPEKAKIAVYHIEDMLENKRNDLPYSKVLTHIANNTVTELDFFFVHALRAAEIFNNRDIACLFPGSILAIDLDKELIQSRPIHLARAYFVAKDTIISTQQVKSFDGPQLTIGYRRGNTYGGTIASLAHQQLVPLNSGSDIRNLIMRGRIDTFLGYLPDSFPIVQGEPGEQALQYDDTSLFYEQNDSFLCQDTPQHRQLVARIDHIIYELESSGELQRIFSALEP